MLIFSLWKKNPVAQAQIKIISAINPSLVQLFGLFTIIVVGEVIVGIVCGVSKHHNLSWNLGGTALLGTLIAIRIWWLYFDFVSHRIPRAGITMVPLWFYLHLPTTIGIAPVWATILNVIEHTGDKVPPEVRWLLVASLAVILISIALLVHTIQSTKEDRRILRVGSIVMWISAILIGISGFLKLSILTNLVIIILLLLAHIFFGFLAWLKESKI